MVGATISHFRVLRGIACGGMGIVYEAEDLTLSRHVALKFLPEVVSADPVALDRFRREARAASSLNHPNICTIFEFGESEGQHFIVMELIAGHSLADLVGARQPISSDQVLSYGAQIADALAAAHEKGIIHRDIKPANVFITERGQAKLLDFGLAKQMPQAAAAAGYASQETVDGLTHTGQVLGTVSYMSPEQVLGKPVDARTDIFSLGMLLYNMATGVEPYRGDTAAAIFDAILHSQPVAPVRLNPDIPAELERIILRCLEKDCVLRYQTASDLRGDLLRAQRGPAADSLPGTSNSETSRVRSTVAAVSARAVRRPWLVAVILLLFASVSVWLVRRAAYPAGSSEKTLAVLPFYNVNSDPGTDFLRIALADDVVTSLSHMRMLALRPFAFSMKYSAQGMDPALAARDLRVQTLLTGHYVREGQQVRVTVELIDVKGRLLWSDSVTAPVDDLIRLQQELKARISDAVTAQLALPRDFSPVARAPANPEAYELYLKSASVPWKEGQNGEAIAMLERATSIDPQYEPAWNALGLRYSYEAGVGLASCPCEPNFGEDNGNREKGKQAYRRAVSLDPLAVAPATALVVFEVQEGNLADAYDDAVAIARRRSDSAEAHLSLAFVLRYAGLLKESAAECDDALVLDARNATLRSCAYTFLQLGQYDKAAKYVEIDGGSDWAARAMADIHLRQGRPAAAVLRNSPKESTLALLQACFSHAGADQISQLGLQVESAIPASADSETDYFVGAYESACGQAAPAIRLLRRAISRSYCSVPAVDQDPFFASLRNSPEFPFVHKDAVACQQRFLAHMNTHDQVPSRTGKHAASVFQPAPNSGGGS